MSSTSSVFRYVANIILILSIVLLIQSMETVPVRENIRGFNTTRTTDIKNTNALYRRKLYGGSGQPPRQPPRQQQQQGGGGGGVFESLKESLKKWIKNFLSDPLNFVIAAGMAVVQDLIRLWIKFCKKKYSFEGHRIQRQDKTMQFWAKELKESEPNMLTLFVEKRYIPCFHSLCCIFYVSLCGQYIFFCERGKEVGTIVIDRNSTVKQLRDAIKKKGFKGCRSIYIQNTPLKNWGKVTRVRLKDDTKLLSSYELMQNFTTIRAHGRCRWLGSICFLTRDLAIWIIMSQVTLIKLVAKISAGISEFAIPALLTPEWWIDMKNICKDLKILFSCKYPDCDGPPSKLFNKWDAEYLQNHGGDISGYPKILERNFYCRCCCFKGYGPYHTKKEWGWDIVWNYLSILGNVKMKREDYLGLEPTSKAGFLKSGLKQLATGVGMGEEMELVGGLVSGATEAARMLKKMEENDKLQAMNAKVTAEAVAKAETEAAVAKKEMDDAIKKSVSNKFVEDGKNGVINFKQRYKLKAEKARNALAKAKKEAEKAAVVNAKLEEEATALHAKHVKVEKARNTLAKTKKDAEEAAVVNLHAKHAATTNKQISLEEKTAKVESRYIPKKHAATTNKQISKKADESNVYKPPHFCSLHFLCCRTNKHIEEAIQQHFEQSGGSNTTRNGHTKVLPVQENDPSPRSGKNKLSRTKTAVDL